MTAATASGGRVSRRLEPADVDERERPDSGERRDDHRRQRVARSAASGTAWCVVAFTTNRPPNATAPATTPAPARGAERALELRPRRGRRRRRPGTPPQVGAVADREHADEDRGRVQPARQHVARRRCRPGRDRRRSRRPRRRARTGSGSRRARRSCRSRWTPAGSAAPAAQCVGGAAEDDPEHGDEQRHRRASRRSTRTPPGTRSRTPSGRRSATRGWPPTPGAIDWWACSRTRSASARRGRRQLPEAGAEVRAAQHRVQGEPGEHEHERERVQHGQAGSGSRPTVGSGSGQLERRPGQAPQHPGQPARDAT